MTKDNATLALQELAEESFGSPAVATRLDEDVDDIAVLINHTPKILPSTLDRHEDLVQVPGVSQATQSPLQPTGVFETELDAPEPDRLIRNRDATPSEHLFHVSKAHAESMVEPNRVADDFRRESVSTVARCFALHQPSLAGAVSI